MLKRISVQQLAVGMRLKEFCGSWLEHPFWRTAFVITDPQDIDSILASSIKPELVDLTRKGCPEKIAGREDPAKWNFPDLDQLCSGLPGVPW